MTSLILQKTDLSENVLSKVNEILDSETETETAEKYRQLVVLG